MKEKRKTIFCSFILETIGVKGRKTLSTITCPLQRNQECMHACMLVLVVG